LDRVTIADFNGTTISLPIQKIDTLELWFEQNIGMAVRRLCERISGYRGRSEKDGENGRKFSASTQKPPFIVGISIFAAASLWCGISPNVTQLILAQRASRRRSRFTDPQCAGDYRRNFR